MFLVTLIYEDESTFFVGGFLSIDEAWAWIDEEKTRPYWKEGTSVQVVDTTPAPPEDPVEPENPTPPFEEPQTPDDGE